MDALKSKETSQTAAKELGFGAEDVAAALEGFDKFPLSDEDLQDALGGFFPKQLNPMKETKEGKLDYEFYRKGVL